MELLEPNIEQIEQKHKKYFYCDSCDYLTSRKLNYNRHKLTAKHLKLNLEPKNAQFGAEPYSMEPNIEQIEQIEQNNGKEFSYKCNCGREYKYSRGLAKHKKLCEHQNNQSNIVKTYQESSHHDMKMLTDLVLEVVKQNKELVTLNNEAQKHNQELTNKLVEMCGNVTNNTQINNNSHNNNKTFNLNMFLNETCKDAMNINDFIDSLQLQLSDLEEVGKLGFVEGISNIIVKNLKAKDVHKRPVHCADKKREIIYIKDDDKWEKENEQKLKLRKAIKRVAFKNEKLLPKYKELHPGCNYSESKYSDHYSKLVIEAMGGTGNNDADNEDKIIRRIAKEVLIDKS